MHRAMNDVVKQVLQTTPPCGRTEVYFGPEGTDVDWSGKFWPFKSSNVRVFFSSQWAWFVGKVSHAGKMIKVEMPRKLFDVLRADVNTWDKEKHVLC